MLCLEIVSNFCKQFLLSKNIFVARLRIDKMNEMWFWPGKWPGIFAWEFVFVNCQMSFCVTNFSLKIEMSPFMLVCGLWDPVPGGSWPELLFSMHSYTAIDCINYRKIQWVTEPQHSTQLCFQEHPIQRERPLTYLYGLQLQCLLIV